MNFYRGLRALRLRSHDTRALNALISLYGKNVIKSGTSGTVRGFVLLGRFALRYFVLRATSRLH